MPEINRQICFYSDAPEWGGQEILSARIANALVDRFSEIVFIHSCPRFQSALDPKITTVRLPFSTSTPFPIIRDRSPRKRQIVQAILRERRVENLVVCPGNIERCLPAIFAAKRLGIRIVSYFPMAYTQKESGAALGKIRDILAKTVYSKISEWVVISKVQETLLRRFIPKSVPVHSLPNPLSWETRQEPKIPKLPLRIATIGRIYFSQKGQDFIPALARELRERKFPCSFQIVGNGPDARKLENLIRKKRVGESVHLSGWTSPEKLREQMINGFDLLLVPSRFEGDPLIIPEAMQCGLPVLVANREYAAEYALPDWMTFTPGDVFDATLKITELSKNYDRETFLTTRKRLLENRDNAAFTQTAENIFLKIFGREHG